MSPQAFMMMTYLTLTLVRNAGEVPRLYRWLRDARVGTR
jgi:hypothetical protein